MQTIERKFYFISIMKTVKKYGEYESFGELALIENKGRRAAKLQVSNAGDAHFAIMSRKDYRATQAKAEMEVLSQKKAFLRSFFIFERLSDAALSSLIKGSGELSCSKG